MARRSLSTRGRILAAGVTVAVGGGLVGFMAAGDHSADASATSSSNSSSSSASTPNDQGTSATPSDGQSSSGQDRYGTPSGDTGFNPQPQTRTGGS